MNYIVTAATDVGIRKKQNEDSLMVQNLRLGNKKAAFAVLCDGMGGLARGEVASASIIEAFRRWSRSSLADWIKAGEEKDALRLQWQKVLADMNEKLSQYGKANRVKLGSTVTAMLLLDDRYYLLNVGDSRIYEITQKTRLLTKDQTLVEREVQQGRLTEEEARRDPRRNVLLQCIGATDMVYPDMLEGRCQKNAVYLLCSDGFRHEITAGEMQEAFAPSAMTDTEIMRKQAIRMIELNKTRKERDNISVILIRTF